MGMNYPERMAVWRRDIRKALLERDGPRCFWCDRHTADKPKAGQLKATVEHITPRSRGGSDDLSNLVIACLPCNAERGDIPAEVFMLRKVSHRTNRKAKA